VLISGVTILRNAVALGYPFEESIRSLLPLVDELVVGIGDCQDGTWEAVQRIGDGRLQPFGTTWDLSPANARVLSVQTNLALERCRGDWAVYLQADEVLHEEDIASIRRAIERHHFRSTEGLTFAYRNFYESHSLLATDYRYWSPIGVRAIRTGIGIVSTGDAAGFRLRRGRLDRGLITAPSGARVFHYGWCLDPQIAGRKHRNLSSLYAGGAEVAARSLPPATHGRPGRLERFTERHPAVMRPRVEAERWTVSEQTLAAVGQGAALRPPRHREHVRRLVRYSVPEPVKNLCWRMLEVVSGSGPRVQIRIALTACRRFMREHAAVDRTLRSAREIGRAARRGVRRRRLPPVERQRDVITNSTLGNHQFGNQFFQYVFLRTYAARHGLRWECTPWMGEKLYGHPPSRITRLLPELREKFEHDIDDTIIPHLGEPVRNVDLRGYFQYHTSYYRPDRDFIRDLATPVGRYKEAADEQWRRLLQRGRTVVALHLRRRYDGAGYFFVTPSSWYRPWLEEIWPTLEDPVLFLATDAAERVRSDFADYDPVVGADLSPPLEDFPFFLDFDALTRCHRLAISNSSFSFAAAMLNRTATAFLRPVLPLQRLVPFDPWDAKPLLQDALVEDYPHVHGIAGNVLGA